MYQMEKVIVLGGDHRQYYLADTLQKNGYHVCSYGVLMPEKNNIEWIKPDKVKQEIRESEMIVLPIPVSVDGKTIRQETADDVLLLSELYDGIRAGQKIYGGILSEQLRSVCREKEAFCYDFMEDESVAVGNAVATAEGAVAEAILLGDETIHGKDCLVIGYGKCGAVLADKLKGLQAKVTVMARNPVSRAKARSMGYEVRPMFSHQEVQKEKFKYLFNTVPTLVLTEQVLSGFDRSTVIIDIASKPGGTDFEYCRYAGIRAKLALSLPGKYASRSSGEILAQAIMNS